MPWDEKYRRRLYLGKDKITQDGGVEGARQEMFCNDYFMNALPDTEKEGAVSCDDDEDEDEDEDEASNSKSGQETRHSCYANWPQRSYVIGRRRARSLWFSQTCNGLLQACHTHQYLHSSNSSAFLMTGFHGSRRFEKLRFE